MSRLEQDRNDILELHRNWWLANQRVDIPLMKTCFPVGMNYLMFNFNWHPYFGLDEKVRLWEYYKSFDLSLSEPPEVRVLKLEIVGDLAYIACELEMITVVPEDVSGMTEEVQALPTPGEKTVERGRATEIYKRDDGEGRPLWKMWHFHSSPLAPANVVRPGFNDTAASRGPLGWNPWSEPLDALRRSRG